jgi:hypothetical protein
MNDKNPSLLFILTGLGRYSWYKLPFLKRHTFCASLPRIITVRIKSALRLGSTYGSCKCKNASCKWVDIFGVPIGMCKKERAKYKNHSYQYSALVTEAD